MGVTRGWEEWSKLQGTYENQGQSWIFQLCPVSWIALLQIYCINYVL